MERQNSELKCELQTADGSSGYSEIGSNNFMTFSSQNQTSVKGNSLYVPALNGIRKFVDFKIEVQPKLDVKPCVSFEPDSGNKDEFVDFGLGYCRQVKDGEQDRIAGLNESPMCFEDFLNMVEKPGEVDKLKFERKLQQESLQSRNIFQKSKNNNDSDGFENKYDSAHSENSCVGAQQERHSGPTGGEEI